MPTPQWFADVLRRELRIELTDQQLSLLDEHYRLLELWNKKMNLTSVPAGIETVKRHYCESLFFAEELSRFEPITTVVDVGTGAGFPGVPMAILKPEWQITLLESSQRKAVFLRESSRRLPNVRVSAQRAEDVAGTFDWVVSRAVDPATVLSNVPRLAAKVGLMVGEDDFSTLKTSTAIAWSEPVRLPWGDRRVCAFGRFHVEHIG
jgi:16S rRNA (guanine527-N7)-methyltransferase